MMKEKLPKILTKIIISFRTLFWIFGSVVSLVIIWNVSFYVGIRKPGLCTVCHFEMPYYNQWKSSTHNNISCYRCHPISQGHFLLNTIKYLTGNYQMRPRAEVHDETCLNADCHAKMDVNEKVPFKNNILFSHKEHLGKLRQGKKLHCTSCHSQIVQGKHLAVTEQTCYLCHFKGTQEGYTVSKCLTCHEAPTKIVEHDGFVFSHESYLNLGIPCTQCHVQIVRGTGKVNEERCYSCHIERLEQFNNSSLIHSTHVENKIIDCLACHEQIQHGNMQMISTLEVGCENCHSRLHYFQKEMYIGSGSRGTPNTPSRMFMAQLSCDGCHTHLIASHKVTSIEKSYEAAKKSCVDCHGPKYDLLLENWTKTMKKMVTDFQIPLQNARLTYQNLCKSGKDTSRVKQLWDDIQFNVEFVNQGHGEHNVEYAVKIMKNTTRMIDTLRKMENPQIKPLKLGKLFDAPDGYCTILCHSTLGVPLKLKFEQMDFPHELHHEKLSIACTRCHSPEKHKMRIITKSECMNCHHEKTKVECNVCHKSQSDLYYGKIKGIPDAEPDIMAQGEISCDGCHDLSEKTPPLESVKNKCIGCHEDGYDKLLIDWYKDLQEERVKILLLVEETKDNLEKNRNKISDWEKKKSQLEQSEHLLNIVEEGRGIHNPKLTQNIYALVRKQLEFDKNRK